MNETKRIIAVFNEIYGNEGLSPEELLKLYVAFMLGWNANKPVIKIGRPKGKAAPKSKKAKES